MTQHVLTRIINSRINHNRISTKHPFKQLSIHPRCGLCGDLIEVGDEVESGSSHSINHVSCLDNSRI